MFFIFKNYKRTRLNDHEEIDSLSEISNFLRNESLDEENCTDELSFYDIYPASAISNNDTGRLDLNRILFCFTFHRRMGKWDFKRRSKI